jgi:hypothetical protein
MLTARRRALFASLSIGLVIAVGVPLVDLWRACRRLDSEACVWGKALWPVSLALWTAVGICAALVTFFIVRARQQRDVARQELGR